MMSKSVVSQVFKCSDCGATFSALKRNHGRARVLCASCKRENARFARRFRLDQRPFIRASRAEGRVYDRSRADLHQPLASEPRHYYSPIFDIEFEMSRSAIRKRRKQRHAD